MLKKLITKLKREKGCCSVREYIGLVIVTAIIAGGVLWEIIQYINKTK